MPRDSPPYRESKFSVSALTSIHQRGHYPRLERTPPLRNTNLRVHPRWHIVVADTCPPKPSPACMMDIPFLPLEGSSAILSTPSIAPTSHSWTLMFRPVEWVYTDGSDIKGQPLLIRAVVVYVPTCTTIYIDAGGTNETRTIMRAKLVHQYGPRKARHARMGGDLHGLPLQPLGHPAPLYKPGDSRPSTSSSPHAPIGRHNGPPRGETWTRV